MYPIWQVPQAKMTEQDFKLSYALIELTSFTELRLSFGPLPCIQDIDVCGHLQSSTNIMSKFRQIYSSNPSEINIQPTWLFYLSFFLNPKLLQWQFPKCDIKPPMQWQISKHIWMNCYFCFDYTRLWLGSWPVQLSISISQTPGTHNESSKMKSWNHISECPKLWHSTGARDRCNLFCSFFLWWITYKDEQIWWLLTCVSGIWAFIYFFFPDVLNNQAIKK